MKKIFYESVPVVMWIAVIASSLAWNVQTIDSNMVDVVTNMGRAFFEEIQTTRLWNAQHGGVYVTVTEETQPNPYLKVPKRDVITTDGVKLTKLNPAFMTRQIAELAQKASGVQYHITSLKPIRPENKADEWETKVLTGMETGKYKEFFELVESTRQYRYMGVLPVKEACMKCHEQQGYHVGDVRGGISVTIPADAYLATAKGDKIRLTILHLVAFLAGIVSFHLFKRFRDQQMILMDKKNVELARERDVAAKAQAETAAANKKITESISYAQNIQTSILPDMAQLGLLLPDSFVIWMPKDIVGGDMIFAQWDANHLLLAVIDCTGHGVPGAFMTILASSSLKSIVREDNRRNPASILQELDQFVRKSLKQDTDATTSDDGLDIALCSFDWQKRLLTFAGARLPLLYVADQKMNEIKGEHRSLGYKTSNADFVFTNHELPIEKNMMFFLATDGIDDQFGGAKGLPFGGRRLRKVFLEGVEQPFAIQKERIVSAFLEYKGENEQVDDVTVVGFMCPADLGGGAVSPVPVSEQANNVLEEDS